MRLLLRNSFQGRFAVSRVSFVSFPRCSGSGDVGTARLCASAGSESVRQGSGFICGQFTDGWVAAHGVDHAKPQPTGELGVTQTSSPVTPEGHRVW